MVDYTIIILGILCIIGLRRATALNDTELFSLDQSNYLKIIFAFGVLIHHISQYTNAGRIFPVFKSSGALFVAGFFAISGYGLMKQYLVYKKNYLQTFFAKRYPALIIAYVVTVIFYLLLRIFVEKDYQPIKERIQLGEPLNYIGWYIFAIMIFYFCFYMACRLSKDNINRIVVLMFIFVAVYVAVCILVGYREWWYESSGSFVIGIILAAYEKNLLDTRILNKISIFLSGVFMIGSILAMRMVNILSDNCQLIISISSCVAGLIFALFSIAFVRKIDCSKAFIRKFSKYALDIYLVQVVPIKLYRSQLITIKNSWIYVPCVVVTTFILAYICNNLERLVLKYLKGFCLKNNK